MLSFALHDRDPWQRRLPLLSVVAAELKAAYSDSESALSDSGGSLCHAHDDSPAQPIVILFQPDDLFAV